MIYYFEKVYDFDQMHDSKKGLWVFWLYLQAVEITSYLALYIIRVMALYIRFTKRISSCKIIKLWQFSKNMCTVRI